MTDEQARKLLGPYADGLLGIQEAREVEATVAASPQLQAELKKIQEENALLTEALAPLRPTRSARMRVSEAMQQAAEEMHRRAQQMADSLPERGWRVFRLSFAMAAAIVGVLLAYFHPARQVTDQETYLLYYATLGCFAVGVIFLLAGSVLARLEARLVSLVSKEEAEPTRLEILMLEVFGILSILTAGILYLCR
ncbi:MAG: hypothetical protein NTW87_30380 [Planctomycetota bacterium]|nr:hypothetical protein [Planctomycetota bacterium]